MSTTKSQEGPNPPQPGKQDTAGDKVHKTHGEYRAGADGELDVDAGKAWGPADKNDPKKNGTDS